MENRQKYVAFGKTRQKHVEFMKTEKHVAFWKTVDNTLCMYIAQNKCRKHEEHIGIENSSHLR